VCRSSSADVGDAKVRQRFRSATHRLIADVGVGKPARARPIIASIRFHDGTRSKYSSATEPSIRMRNRKRISGVMASYVQLPTPMDSRDACAVVLIVGLSCAGCRSAHKPFVAQQAAPGILAGDQPRSQADYEFLRAHGVRTILSLEDLPWTVAADRKHAEALGMTFRNVPIPASPLQPSERHMKEVLMTLHDPTLRPIFVHCNLGRDRTAMVMGLYHVYYEGWTPQAAWAEMLRSGFKVSWTLRGLRTYFWSHTQKPDWVTRAAVTWMRRCLALMNA
jgi:protein tyrosine phosphatase (PTP) superfamily phosphohydrolase (DUF442 family)